jgi:hypothetical protein
MGVKDGSKAADQILGLTLAQFCAMMRNQAETNGRSGKPALDIDASWLWYKFKNRSGGPLGNIVAFVKFLAREGFAINVVCDADERHDSKRASIDRRVGREHARLMAVEAKVQIMRLSMKLRDGEYNTEAERADMESRRNWLSKYSATDSNLEGGGGPPDDYYAQLRNNLQTREIGHRGGSIDVVKAVCQADFHIAHRIVGKLTDGVISNDADYHFITGVAVCITHFNFSSRNAGGRMDSIVISSASRETIQRLAESVRISVLVANDQYKPASVRILDDASPRLRCLFAVALGCDSYVGGVPGLGISALNARFRASDQAATYDDMLNYVCADKLVKGIPAGEKAAAIVAKKAMLDTFVDSLMYEPAKAIEGTDGQMSFLYVHESPAELPKYLESFASAQTAVKDGPALCTCNGYGSGEHAFVAEEGKGKCSTCDKTYCRLCVVDVNKRENNRRKKNNEDLLPVTNRCLHCIGGTIDESSAAVTQISAMREALLEAGVHGISKATDGEIMDMHDGIIDKKEIDAHSDLIEKIQFPELSNFAMTDGTLAPIIRFDMCNGAAFLLSDELSTEQVISTVDLFASLVVYSAADTPGLKPYEDALPQMLLKFCDGSRVDDGQRLAFRAIRHANDPNADSAFNARCELSEHNGEMVTVMHHNMYASFKSERYETSVAFRKDAIVACKCGCPAGAELREKHDRHVDVHVVPVMYLLALLLFDGLAYDLLVNLAERWKPSDDNHPKADLLSNAVDLLTVAAGKELAPRQNAKVSERLDRFAVGTEKSKLRTPPPRSTDTLGPLRRHGRLVNPKTTTKKRIRLVKQAVADGPAIDSKGCMDVDDADSEASPASGDANDAEATGANGNNDEDGAMVEDDGDSDDLGPFNPSCFILTRFTRCWKELVGDKSQAHEDFIGYKVAQEEAGTRSEAETSMIDGAARTALAGLVKKAEQRGRPKGSPSSSATSPTTAPPEPSPPRERTLSSSPLLAWGKRAGTRRAGCCFDGCGETDLDPNRPGKWFSVPSYPPDLKDPDRTSLKARITYSKRRFAREEHNRRCNLPAKDKKDRRICNRHRFDPNSNIHSVPLQYRKDNEPRCHPFGEFYKAQSRGFVVPRGRYYSQHDEKESRGVAADRQLARVLKESREAAERLAQQTAEKYPETPEPVKDALMGLAGEARSWKEHAQCRDAVGLAQDLGEDLHKSISPIVAREAGLSVHPGRSVVPQELPIRLNRKRGRESPSVADEDASDPVITLGVSDEDIKDCTGFDSLLSMLYFITVTCNCDADLMADTVTSLTWLEEWHLYFEMVWGRSCLRWSDARRKYGLSDRQLKRAFRKKLALAKRARDSWPAYVSMEVDSKLRSEKWNDRYAGKRVVMWDNTNVNMPKPHDARMQRQTYSAYYGGNVGKGAIGLQLCGWMRTHELWDGAVSDSEYFEKSGILEMQAEFAASSNNPDVQFTNILDKGYHAVLAAWRVSKQLILQPAYKKSERKFTSAEVLLSAAVAADRSGNERAVNVAKRCYILGKGIDPSHRLDIIDDIWQAWGFQANFMYAPVL